MDPSGSRVAVRGAKLSDIETLARIELASFAADRLSRRSLKRHLTSDSASFLIAMLDGRAVGYALLFYRINSSIARLYSIATLAEARGKGVARALLSACEREARRRGKSILRLEVKTSNASAIGLYEHNGYLAFGRYEAYYEDGAPAIRMEKTLNAKSAKSFSPSRQTAARRPHARAA